MALKYGFYNAEYKNGEYDRTYDADDFGRLFSCLISDGVIKTSDNAFVVVKNGNNTVTVMPGSAWFKRTWNILDGLLRLSVPTSSPLCAVVLRVDKKNRTNEIIVKTGGNTVSLTQSDFDEVYEYCLAYVYISGGAISRVESHIGNGTTNVTPWATSRIGGGSGGTSSTTTIDASTYATAIKFKGSSKFALTFKTSNGLT